LNSLEMVFYKDAAANGMTVWQYCLHLNPLSKLRYFLRIYGRVYFRFFVLCYFAANRRMFPAYLAIALIFLF